MTPTQRRALEVAAQGCMILSDLLTKAKQLDDTLTELEKAPDGDDYNELYSLILGASRQLNAAAVAGADVITRASALDAGEAHT